MCGFQINEYEYSLTFSLNYMVYTGSGDKGAIPSYLVPLFTKVLKQKIEILLYREQSPTLIKQLCLFLFETTPSASE